ncbi:DUF937 domain-containing protein [Microbacterium sp. BK668]|uniref:DUF937 domain-containing protein n=1 Tax=Microbacterium sp. BK668 TaxID=2512118 RepID=UPI00105FC553|nr:DUF937 domain-containing protein [Microbacterium sp. BK668]TDN91506.1 uncharacterized protein DUF937 [Microbacterium sp. BK668]
MDGNDEILNSLPVNEIAAKLGVDPSVARQAIQEGGATILTGLQRNAQTPEGSQSILNALDKHSGTIGEGTVDVDSVDTADGQKILGHIFGDQQQAVAQKLTSEPQTAGIDFGKLLPILAPIVLGLIAKKQGSTSGGAGSGTSAGGGGIGDIIGGLLGGSGSGGGSSAGGIDIGGLLGGLFGGRK